jgi:hypothetical protein
MPLQKPNGMTQVAWEAYQAASEAAGINITGRADARVVQAYGHAKASRGTHLHEPRSEAQPNLNRYVISGEYYSAAADLSVRSSSGYLTNTLIATWIEELCRAGFVAFFRSRPSFSPHIHAVYAGVRMKGVLRSQCRDFFAGRNGLVSHSSIEDEFWCPSAELRSIPRRMFNLSNGKKPQVVPSPAVQGKVEVATKTYALYLNDKLLLHMPVIDGVALAPVRAWGTALGFKVNWLPREKSIQFVQKNGVAVDVPAAITLIAHVGHAPIRQLTAAAGLKIAVDNKNRTVIVSR